jgi:CDP-4-dehydro-6-deoxyglucose reductase
MSYTVTVLPSNQQFSLESDESILEAALRQAVVLPYGCKNGACGTCRVRVQSGSLDQGPHQPSALTAADAAAGYALVCCGHAQSDLVIEARVVSGAGDIPVRKMPCRVASLTPLAPDVIELMLQLPASERFQYLPGQYIELILKDGTRRSYSLAQPPHLDGPLALHIRHVPGGVFTDALFGVTQPAIKVRDILRFEGPMGTFFLREDSSRPIVLLASGTGFAPIKAIIEHARHRDIKRPIFLYWGGRRPHDLYQRALCDAWVQDWPDFHFVPVVSAALPEDSWTGRTGWVHQAVMEDFSDLSGYEVYACGAPAMVEAARRDFLAERRLPEQAFFADAFTDASHRVVSNP